MSVDLQLGWRWRSILGVQVSMLVLIYEISPNIAPASLDVQQLFVTRTSKRSKPLKLSMRASPIQFTRWRSILHKSGNIRQPFVTDLLHDALACSSRCCWRCSRCTELLYSLAGRFPELAVGTFAGRCRQAHRHLWFDHVVSARSNSCRHYLLRCHQHSTSVCSLLRAIITISSSC